MPNYQLTDYGLSTRWPSTYNPRNANADTPTFPTYMPGSSIGQSWSGGGSSGTTGTRYNSNTGTWDSTSSPTFNSATGRWVTGGGADFTGVDPVTGTRYSGGYKTGETVPYSGGQTINPNDATQRYEGVSTVKIPELNSEADKLMTTFNTNATNALQGQDFTNLVNNYKNQLAGTASKYATATDASGVSNALRGYQQTYSGKLDQLAQNAQNLDQNVANQWAGINKQAGDYLTNFDTAENALGNYNVGLTNQNIAARYSAGGTPTSTGSGLVRETLRAADAIKVPIELAKAQQRYTNLNQYTIPALQQNAAMEQTRIEQFDPAIAAQQFQSGQATAQTIQAIAERVATMSEAAARQYMTDMFVPQEMQQQFLSGQIGQAGQIGGIKTNANYYGLQDKMGANLTQGQDYSFVAPQGDRNRYSGGGGGGGGNQGGSGGSTTPAGQRVLGGGVVGGGSGSGLGDGGYEDWLTQVNPGSNTSQDSGYEDWLARVNPGSNTSQDSGYEDWLARVNPGYSSGGGNGASGGGNGASGGGGW